MEEEIVMKIEKVCRTCLDDENPQYFNISHAFDHVTISQMITDITALQIDSEDEYTQSICFKCVNEVRRAHEFRKKCIESSETLANMVQKNPLQKLECLEEIPILDHCKIDPPKVDDVKEEPEDSFACTDVLEAEYRDDDEDSLKTEPDETESHKSDSDKETKEDLNIEQVARKKKLKIIFDCSLCHGFFMNEQIFKKHILELHPDYEKDENLIKARVPRGFIIKRKMNKIVKTVFTCALDDFAGKSFVEFKNHMTIHVGERPIVCTLCDFTTKNIPLLKKHRIQKHIAEKNISCPHCDYVGKRKNDLTNHLIVHTTEKNVKCELCNATFKRLTGLIGHRKIKHEKVKPKNVCTICQKGFHNINKLETHMLTHTGEKPHICHYCGKAYVQRYTLLTHVALKHEISNAMFKCDHCPFTTKRKIYLTAHMKTHSEKKYPCPHCPFKSNKSCNLKIHIMRHFGKKKYSCDMCDYKCMRDYDLTVHKRIHTGEKPFSCTVCMFRTRSQETLKCHMQTHNTDLKYACPNCPYKANVQRTLQKHTRKCVFKTQGRIPSKRSRVLQLLETGDEKEEANVKTLQNDDTL